MPCSTGDAGHGPLFRGVAQRRKRRAITHTTIPPMHNGGESHDSTRPSGARSCLCLSKQCAILRKALANIIGIYIANFLRVVTTDYGIARIM